MSYGELMPPDTFTLKEVAAILCPSGDAPEVERIARQVRHWTVADLLRPTGKKHTGTGTSRRYSVDEVRKAAILTELARYRVPITALGSFTAMAESYATSREWRKAVEDREPVFLQLAFSKGANSWQIFVGQPVGNFIAPTAAQRNRAGEGFVSAVIVNLSALFRRLRF